VPTLVLDHLHDGAGAFSLVMVGYAAGAIVSGAVLARRPLRRKSFVSLAWTLYLPAYALIALGGALLTAVTGAFAAARAQSSAQVLSSLPRRRTCRTRCSAACSG
jgi:hypothetical protein